MAQKDYPFMTIAELRIVEKAAGDWIASHLNHPQIVLARQRYTRILKYLNAKLERTPIFTGARS